MDNFDFTAFVNDCDLPVVDPLGVFKPPRDVSSEVLFAVEVDSEFVDKFNARAELVRAMEEAFEGIL